MLNLKNLFKKRDKDVTAHTEPPKEDTQIKRWIIDSITVLNVHTGTTYEYMTHNGYGLGTTLTQVYRIDQKENISGGQAYTRAFFDINTMAIIKVRHKEVLFINDIPQGRFHNPYLDDAKPENKPS